VRDVPPPVLDIPSSSSLYMLKPSSVFRPGAAVNEFKIAEQDEAY
jgi:hypothetical protein